MQGQVAHLNGKQDQVAGNLLIGGVKLMRLTVAFDRFFVVLVVSVNDAQNVPAETA